MLTSRRCRRCRRSVRRWRCGRLPFWRGRSAARRTGQGPAQPARAQKHGQAVGHRDLERGRQDGLIGDVFDVADAQRCGFGCAQAAAVKPPAGGGTAHLDQAHHVAGGLVEIGQVRVGGDSVGQRGLGQHGQGAGKAPIGARQTFAQGHRVLLGRRLRLFGVIAKAADRGLFHEPPGLGNDGRCRGDRWHGGVPVWEGRGLSSGPGRVWVRRGA
jgi:hypothetical protein